MGLYHLLLFVSIDQPLPQASLLGTIVPLYVGPDQVLPLASALGAAVGVLLIVGHRVVALGRRAWQFFTKKPADTGAESVARRATAGVEAGIGQQKVDLAD
jgi:hypothetical protein